MQSWVPRERIEAAEGQNLAGEPRDALRFADIALAADAAAPSAVEFDTLWHLGALARAADLLDRSQYSR